MPLLELPAPFITPLIAYPLLAARFTRRRFSSMRFWHSFRSRRTSISLASTLFRVDDDEPEPDGNTEDAGGWDETSDAVAATVAIESFVGVPAGEAVLESDPLE